MYHSIKQHRFIVLLFILILGIILGTLIILNPWGMLLLLSSVFLSGIMVSMVLAIGNLSFWQKLAFFSLTGYMILNYGFANWTFHLGKIVIPIGHLFSFVALILALSRNTDSFNPFVRKPIVICWLLLLVMSIIHLVIDIPKYKAYAIRDVSFIVEGIFLLLGFIWARNLNNIKLFTRVLTIVFFLNFIYSLSFPFRDIILSLSPVSGIFQQVPVFGFYQQTSLFLLAGALFYLLVANQVFKARPKIFLILAILQAGWSLVFQERSIYIGIILVILILIVDSKDNRGGVRVAISLVFGICILFITLSISGISIKGRMGQVNFDFFLQHARSLLLVSDTPGVGTVNWRINLFYEVWNRWTASLVNIIAGEGFGQALIDFHLNSGIAVRQPHNTHITIVMRLGLIGIAIWGIMQWKVFSLFIRSLRNTRQNSFKHNLFLWLFLFYIISMLYTSVQPWLEFSYGAIPFFTIIGFTLGLGEHTEHANR